MADNYTKFAYLLINELIQDDTAWNVDPLHPEIVNITNDKQQLINLNLTPFDAIKHSDRVEKYCNNITSIEDLIDAYYQIKHDYKFESELSELLVSDYAADFLTEIFEIARNTITANDVSLIVNFVKNLDCYTAVKSIESLLYSHSDLELLRIAKQQNWIVHFDHIAIRCGSSENNSAKKVAELLINNYGYSQAQIKSEQFYLFNEGWSAYPLYKMLSNGQVLRIFVDQSETSNPEQIIQHWNQVYGFTAHHLALRITKIEKGERKAVPLPDIISRMVDHGRGVLTPTGYYTEGLLTQVFTKPEKNHKIPDTLMQQKKSISKHLPDMLVNAKLLEIVSRKEMSRDLAKHYFELYNIEYDINNPLHSSVYYQYFLPAQAAHVIKSSLEV
ncbi:MAG: hypothetical protein ACC653_10360 [Gammaproteobacteria bacterium]